MSQCGLRMRGNPFPFSAGVQEILCNRTQLACIWDFGCDSQTSYITLFLLLHATLRSSRLTITMVTTPSPKCGNGIKSMPITKWDISHQDNVAVVHAMWDVSCALLVKHGRHHVYIHTIFIFSWKQNTVLSIQNMNIHNNSLFACNCPAHYHVCTEAEKVLIGNHSWNRGLILTGYTPC